MEKVQSGSITEEFSFSRALHLMRHSEAKVRGVAFAQGQYIYISKFDNQEFIQHIGCPNHFQELMLEDGNTAGFTLLCEDILGNWTMYNERLHG